MKNNYFFLINILLLILLQPVAGKGQCPTPITCNTPPNQNDFDALVALYCSTDGDDWTDNTGWYGAVNNGTDCDYCQWYGVSCDGNGRVIEIDMYNNGGNNLVGSIPNEIGDLEYLSSLVLRSNDFSGSTIPSSLSNLSLLRFNCMFCNLAGPLPDNLLLSLTVQSEGIYLNGNNCSGPLPSQTHLNQEICNLSIPSNNLSSTIPASYYDIDFKCHLNLAANNLSGVISSDILNWINLDELWLQGNSFGGSIPAEIGNMNWLTELFFWGNQFEGCIPSNLLNVCSTANFNNNPLLPWEGDFDEFCLTSGTESEQYGAPCNDGDSANGPDYIDENCICGPCTHQDYDPLMALYDSTNGGNWTNNGTNADPTSTTSGWGKDCDVCQWYGIACDGNNRVTCIDLDGTVNCSNTNSGTSFTNNMTGTIPSEIGNLSKLNHLSLFNNEITGSIPNTIGNLSNLIFLNLRNNELSGVLPSQIGNLSSLEYLILRANNFTNEIPSEIGNLFQLTDLFLSENLFSGSIPISFQNLTNLKNLFLSSNQLTDNIPEIFANMDLIGLSLGNNNLSGSLPSSLSNLINIETIGVANNELNGSVPIFFGDFLLTTVINLSNNNFSGEIPNELGNLVNIDHLYLNGNDFSGEIPSELSNLMIAERIWIYNNNLSGCIPNELFTLCSNNSIQSQFNNELPWNGDFDQFCITDGSQSAQIGAPCDDGNDSNGTDDEILEDCSCGQVCPTIDVTISGLTSACIDTDVEITFNFSDGNGPYTIDWTFGTLTGIIDGHIETISATSSALIEAMSGTDTDGCSISSSNIIDFMVNLLPTANITGTQEICDGQSTTLTAAGGSSYLWNTTESTPSIMVSPSMATEYSVIVTDGNMCTAEAMVSVTVNPLPTVDAGTYTDQCIDGSLLALIGSPSGGTFTGNGVIGDNFNPSTAGLGEHTITYTYTDGNGCTNNVTTDITVTPLPTVDAGLNADQCIDGLLFALMGSPSGGTFTGNGVVGDNFDPSVAGLGVHTITYTYTDGNGCTNSATINIIVNPLPTANISGDTNVCEGSTITLTASGGDTYEWTGGLIGESIDISPLITTLYSVTVTDVNGCINTTDQLVTVNSNPVANNPSPINLCDQGGGMATIDLSDLDVGITGGNPSLTVIYSASSIEPLTPVPNPNNYNINGTTPVFAQVIDGTCLSEVITLNFVIESSLTVNNLSPFTLCTIDGMGIDIDAPSLFDNILTNGNSSITVSWSENELMTPPILIPTFVDGSTTLYVELWDGSCASDISPITFEIEQQPAINSPSNTEVCAFLDDSGEFDLTTYNQEILGGLTYNVIWSEDQSMFDIILFPSSYITVDNTLVYATVDDGTCQSDPLPITLMVNAPPVITPIDPIETCQQTTETVLIDLTEYNDALSIGNTIEWSFDGSSIDGSNFSTAESITLNAQASNSDGCISDIVDVEIILYNLEIEYSVDGSSVEIIKENSTLPMTAMWSGPTSGTQNNINSNTITIDNLINGNYSIIVTDNAGCEQFCEVTIDIVDSSCPHPDYTALMALYASTNGEDWTDNTGWADGATGSNCDPCGEEGNDNWKGLDCDNNRVTSIELINNELDGVLPSTIVFDSLKIFNINNNENLSGSIPNFDASKNLEEIYLNENNLIGGMPAMVLSKLLYLDISKNNSLKGELPSLVGLPYLEEFYCFEDSLFGSLDSIIELPKLKQLWAFNNQFTGNIPNFELDSLKILSIEINLLDGDIPDFGSLQLDSLWINENYLTGPIPDFSHMTNLQLFNASDNNLSGCYPGDMYCDISDINVDFSINAQLPYSGDYNLYCESEQQEGAPCDDGNGIIENCICISNNPCDHQDYDALIALYNSTNGDNWTNNGTQANPQSTTEGWKKDCDPCNWYGIVCDEDDRVVCIDMDGDPNCSISGAASGNNLTGNITTQIGNLTYLKQLILYNNGIKDTIPKEIGNLEYLEELNLGVNKLIGNIPPELGQLSNLKILYLVDDTLSGVIPKELGNLSSLHTLNIANNKLDGNIPMELKNLSNLISLHLHANQLDGNIPPELGELSNLQSLLLYFNKLEGDIPPELGQLTNLTGLNLKLNQLTGPIPGKLGDLENLNLFNLSSNNLSGCIDLNLKKLCDITLKDCSNNPLLPWQGDFQEFCMTNQISEQIGKPCGMALDSIIDENCNCVGKPCTDLDFPTLSDTDINACQGIRFVVSIIDSTKYSSIMWEGGETNFTIDLTLDESKDYGFILLDQDECALDSFIHIKIIEAPNAELLYPIGIDVCNSDDDGQSQINLDTIITGDAGEWQDESGNIVSGVINFDGKDVGLYTYTFATNAAVEPCENIKLFQIFNVIDCYCGASNCKKQHPPQWIDVPTITSINCADLTDELPMLSFSNNQELTCLIEGEVMATRQDIYNNCERAIQYDWTYTTICQDVIDTFIIIQITDLPASYFINIPSDTVINCEAYEQIMFPTLSYHNGSTGICSITGSVDPDIIEMDIQDCEGTIILQWLYIDECGTERSHVQTILVENCTEIQLESELVWINNNEQVLINIHENDQFGNGFQTNITNVSSAIVKNYRLDADGYLEFIIIEPFIDTIIITYEVCDEACEICETAELKILNKALKDLIFTDVITPNGDGFNETLRFNILAEIEDSELRIFNRWGDQIYHKKNYTNDWNADGYPGGIYFYVLEINGVVIKKTLTIIK